MDLILPKFVKNVLEFLVVLFYFIIIDVLLFFYFGFEVRGYISLEDICFVFNIILMYAVFYIFSLSICDKIVINSSWFVSLYLIFSILFLY
ncbi:hypothetical protein ALNOE001_09370 [Candidatus Methanobinarius endosymbioticus]|uniref:Uncharacterized protein n=1 Tax=Candidatus Methanobinarius endosymbioticus TaxID=2006182 RepID=A0A366MCQ2_9EURY|nr:hypothetical protein ALNOE001_09370 [Candidatus Methanobinarius endosymbioticus]